MARPDAPRATYRLQLTGGFTFAQAAALVPYLAELGVSHVYLSLYFKASPGSLHGYDIVDHNALNPEIGSRAELDRLCAALREHGMGQVHDIVPNHVAVLGADNPWWQDVLRNGRAAAHASFFDIDWDRLRDELHGRLLVPVLGEPYGVVLERGELRCAGQTALGAGLSPRVVAHGGRRHQLSPLLRHQRAGGAARGRAGGLRGHPSPAIRARGERSGERRAHRSSRRALRSRRVFFAPAAWRCGAANRFYRGGRQSRAA